MSELLVAKSNIFKNPISTVWVKYNGYLLGCTLGGVTDTPDVDIQEIMCDQKGTKPQDWVYSGLLHVIATVFSEVNEELLSILVPGIENIIGQPDAEMLLASRLYESLRAQKGAPLQLIRSVNNEPSTDPDDIFTFYEVVPVITGELLKFTPDAQQTFPVSFNVVDKKLADVGNGSITEVVINGSTYTNAFGYLGTAANVGVAGVPAADIPNRLGPQFNSAEADTATNLSITFNESVDSLAASPEGLVIATVNGAFVAPTAVAINGVDDKILDCTFPAATFASGQVLTVSAQAGLGLDADTNPSAVFKDKPVTNSAP
jgi:hypothetical protein